MQLKHPNNILSRIILLYYEFLVKTSLKFWTAFLNSRKKQINKFLAGTT